MWLKGMGKYFGRHKSTNKKKKKSFDKVWVIFYNFYSLGDFFASVSDLLLQLSHLLPPHFQLVQENPETDTSPLPKPKNPVIYDWCGKFSCSNGVIQFLSTISTRKKFIKIHLIFKLPGGALNQFFSLFALSVYPRGKLIEGKKNSLEGQKCRRWVLMRNISAIWTSLAWGHRAKCWSNERAKIKILQWI